MSMRLVGRQGYSSPPRKRGRNIGDLHMLEMKMGKFDRDEWRIRIESDVGDDVCDAN